jgi:hypothetical protein
MEQLNLPLTPDLEADNVELTKSLNEELHLELLSRDELEHLYIKKVGLRRFIGRTDDELHTAITNPEQEISRLREVDKKFDQEDIIDTYRR